jgi:YVTN family beta-propeller protein
MYVTTGGDDSVIVVRYRIFLDRAWSTEDKPMGIAYNPDNNLMYTANNEDNDVSVIDINAPFAIGEIEFIQDDTYPIDIAFNPTNHRLYVTQNHINAKSVTAIDTRDNSMITIPDLVGQPWGIAFNEKNGKMYVTTYDPVSKDGKVVIINGFNIEGEPIPVGHNPRGIAYNPTNEKIYVVNEGDSTVSVIDSTNRVVETISVGHRPIAIAYNPFNQRMYVANNGANTVSVIATSGLPTVTPAFLEQVKNTACPEDYVQHWDKIEFMINSTELAQSLKLTANTELDIRIRDDPKNVTDLKQKVLDFINSPNATRDDISIMDVDYAAICASSTPISSGIPTVEILSPANHSLFATNQTITFRGEAQDPEDGELSGASLEWFSDRDGSLGTGNEISTALSGPSPACSFVPHTITLKARDSDGNIGSSNIVVSVGGVC